MTTTYTADEYERMLVAVLDAWYGAAIHHIGDGDGISEDDAGMIREFWQLYLDRLTHPHGKNGKDRRK